MLDAIDASGLTAYALGRDSGIDEGMIRRFVRGERGLSLDSADALAAALGYRLAPAPGRRPGRRPTAPASRPPAQRDDTDPEPDPCDSA